MKNPDPNEAQILDDIPDKKEIIPNLGVRYNTAKRESIVNL